MASEVYAVSPGKNGAVEQPDWAHNALATQGDVRGAITRDEAKRFILFHTRRGLQGSPHVLRWLLGRGSTIVEEWIESRMRAVGRA